MLSRPLSVGFLSLIVFYIMNSFYLPSYNDMIEVFLLSSGSYLVSDYFMNILCQQSGIQTVNVNSIAPNPIQTPIMQSAIQSNALSINRPPVDIGFFGLPFAPGLF